MTEKITSNQENRLCDLFRDAIKALGLSKDEAQEIIKTGGVMQAEIKPILQKLVIADKRFGPAIRQFKILVPVDYNHDTQINASAKKAKREKTTFHYNSNLNSENFAKATNKLIPGKVYTVKIFPILGRVTSEDSLAFLSQQNAILVGGQGATLVYDLTKDQLPKRKWTVSFDEKDALWEDTEGDRRVPCVYAHSGDDFGFDICVFDRDLHGDSVILCFCDK